ncbi:hypothetical protein V8C43DRAFT_221319 [Trichoderma afarasin]
MPLWSCEIGVPWKRKSVRTSRATVFGVWGLGFGVVIEGLEGEFLVMPFFIFLFLTPSRRIGVGARRCKGQAKPIFPFSFNLP